jgi:hypothetical protein
MNDFEFYLNWYNKEAERKTALENSLNIPIGILSVTFGADFYSLAHYNYSSSVYLMNILLFTMVGMSFVFSCVATYFLFVSYHGIFKGYIDKAFPFATELRKHKLELIDYYQKQADNFPGVSGEDKYEEYVITKLTEYIDRNVRNNDKKAEALYRAKGNILRAIVCLVVALIPFILNFFHK